jgi:CHASE2 domain-containing sensor protein
MAGPRPSLLAAMSLYLGTWVWSRTQGTPATPEADRETRNYLLAFAVTTPLITYQWKADTAGWWLTHIPVLAAGVVCAEAGLQYLIRRKSGGPTAQSS